MIRAEKLELVRGLVEKLSGAQSIILADFRGLSVSEMTDLRDRLREKAVELRVVKNRLGKHALSEAGCDGLDDLLKGNTAWAFGLEDPVHPAKILAEFAKENEKLVIKGGLLESKRIDVAMVGKLAALPGREELLGMMANGLMQPATKLASAMNASVVKIARAFSALAQKLEESGSAAS